MKKKIIGLVVGCLVCPALLAQSVRPEADMKRDADRKPTEMLAFAHVMSGQTVVDYLPGGGYFTRVFSAAVGSKGHVIAYEPKAAAERFPEAVNKLKAEAASNLHNVTVTVGGDTLAPKGKANLVWTSQNYHDVYNMGEVATAALNKAAFAALKHGGYYVVLDHAAESGSGARDTKTLHRIDPAFVKADVLKAGFVLDGESKILANAADNHTRNVFDPTLRGHTDQFIFRFRKP